MRIILSASAVLALGACMESEVGTRNQGVGFGNYDLYMQQQAYIDRAGLGANPAPVTMADTSALPPTVEMAAAPSAITTEPLTATGSPATAPVIGSAPALPPGANVAEFALATTHPIGQPMYERSGAALRNADRACARFASDTMAQEEFLKAGGPERDRLGVDPDGDGYACRWDPAAFRLARAG